MNTCRCPRCVGPDKCHYSVYYHREEGFDSEHQNTVRYMRERIHALEDQLRALTYNNNNWSA